MDTIAVSYYYHHGLWNIVIWLLFEIITASLAYGFWKWGKERRDKELSHYQFAMGVCIFCLVVFGIAGIVGLVNLPEWTNMIINPEYYVMHGFEHGCRPCGSK